MLDMNLLKLQLQEGSLTPQGSVDSDVWVVNNGLKMELNFRNILKDEVGNREALFFLWDYSKSKPVWIQSILIENNTITYKYDSSIWKMLNYLGIINVRVGIAYYNGEDTDCRYIKNKYISDASESDEKYVVGSLESKNSTSLTVVWTNNGFLSLKVRTINSLKNRYNNAEVSGYSFDNGHLVIYFETPLVEGSVEIVLGDNYEKAIKSKKNSVCYSIKEMNSTRVSRVFRLDIDCNQLASLDIDDLCLLPSAVINNTVFNFIADPNVIDNRIYDVSCDKKVVLRRNDDGLLKIICAKELYNVLFSVVTAVYNTAPFLAEMIESVLTQKLEKLKAYIKDKSYLDVFEFILVDDGSTDGSSEILDNYAQVSNRIKVIHKENGGVSSARNAGIEIASGKYINFADSDDKFSDNFMHECIMFFEEHEEEISLITTPMMFFDATSGEHWTNYKFGNKNVVANLEDRPDVVNYFVCSSVFKKTDINKLRFDTNLVNGEDIKFIYELINNALPSIGVVQSTTYGYRRRSTGELSAIQAMKDDPRTYTDYLKNVMEYSLLNSMDINGNIPKYVQHMVMGQIQWKLNVEDKGEKGKSVLGDEGFEEYKQYIYKILRYIDADVILAQKKIWNEVKYFALRKKYTVLPKIERNNGLSYFSISENRIETSIEDAYIRMEFMEINNNKLHFEGYGMCFEPDMELIIYVNNNPVDYKEYPHNADKYSLDEICFYAKTFSVDIDLDENVDKYEISFVNKYNDVEYRKRTFRYAKTMPIAQTYSKSYYQVSNWTLRKEDNKFVIRNCLKDKSFIDYEAEFVSEVKSKNKTNNVDHMLKLRKLAIQRRSSRKNPVLLLSDRANVAGDNGEALFKYIKSINDHKVDTFFLLDEDADDYERLQKIGCVIPRKTEAHEIIHLTADYIVSSAADEFVINPWVNDRESAEIVRDFLALPKFIFLQHGITKDDQSTWLNRYNKKITGFICAAPREAQSIREGAYYYKDENVWLTGMPRHDLLYRDEKRWIVIMPTWRQSLAVNSADENSLVEDFTSSEYFKFYDALINDTRLLDAAQKYNYTICFMPHPGIKRNGLKDFHKHSDVMFLDFDVAYKDVYAWADLVMTDYSSSVMDFALLRKPVVYCQFDKDEFFSSHIYKPGYYDYEEDGFGEITYDLDSCVDVMVNYMKNDCKVYEPYGSRMDSFFGFHDQKSSERVYKKIKDLIET